MKTDWWWVRHGPTHEKVFTGWRDVPADLSNIKQINRLKNFLPQNAVFVSSDLQRATATAKAIHSGNQEIIIDHNLREFNFGLWDMKLLISVSLCPLICFYLLCVYNYIPTPILMVEAHR